MSQAPAEKTIPTLGYGDYLRFSRLVHERYGLNFPEKRRMDLEQGVRQAFAASTCEELDGYYRLLLDPDHGAVHLQRLVNALTIGESHFFRNRGQFDALLHHVLPEMIERRRALRTLRIWSAGCAGGQEPYSIAILLRELLPDVDDWAITILATDVNTKALDYARKGLYSEWAFREDRAKQWRYRYFRQAGKRFQIHSDIRQMVTFKQLNLAEDHYPSFQTNTTFMDLILCRNVTIYFAPSMTRQVVDRFYESLIDGGWLVVGHSEHSWTTYRRFQARSYPNAILYQRTGDPTVLPEDWDWLPPTSPASGAPSLRVPPMDEASPSLDRPLASPDDDTPPLGMFTGAPVKAGKPEAPAEEQAPPEPPIDDLLTKAEELLEYGHSVAARDLLLKVVAARPEHTGACTLLGKAYANLGCWEDAERWCELAIETNNVLIEPYYTLALVHQHQGRIDAAIQAMKKVVYLNRASILGHYGLANLYYSQGELPQAIKSLDNAWRLLSSHRDSELIPNSDGVTFGSLRQAITQQQQRWNAEATH